MKLPLYQPDAATATRFLEHRYLCEVVEKQTKRTAWLPWQPEEPVGPDALERLATSNLTPTS